MACFSGGDPGLKLSRLTGLRGWGLRVGCGLALLLGVLAAQGAAWGQSVAPLVAVVEGGKPAGWWVQEGGAPGPALEGVLAAASKAGVPVLKQGGQRPAISRIYRVAQLTPTNAANLGALLGGSHVMTGTLTHEAPPKLEALGLYRHRITARLQLSGTRGGAGQVSVALSREAQGDSPEAARAEAERELGSAAGEALGRAWVELSGPVGLRRAEPWLVLSSAPSWARTEELIQRLGGVKGVKGVQVGWASAGLVGLDINPGQEDSPEAIEAIAAAFVEAAGLGAAPGPAVDGLIVVQGL